MPTEAAQNILKLATVLDNPGEPQSETQYRDPKHLAKLGYNGLVIYQTTGLSGVPTPDIIQSQEMRRWIECQFESINDTITLAGKAGLDVYLAYDSLSLASSLVEKDSLNLTCKHREDMLCPASEQVLTLITDSIHKHLKRWPMVKGIVLRFGDSDAKRLPYLIGNDIYSTHCPRCSSHSPADRIVNLVKRYKKTIDQLDKTLIVRAWNVKPGGMHDHVELAQEVSDRLSEDLEDTNNLIFSFKTSQTDFWRYQAWNPSSQVMGRIPVIYEMQCQREFEGKGAFPNWQAPLWQSADADELTDKEAQGGLTKVVDNINFAGLWSWVRGGGWGGPFIKNESWVDANAWLVPQLADQPNLDIEAAAKRWAGERLLLTTESGIDAVVQTLKLSPEYILKGIYFKEYTQVQHDKKKSNAYWHPNSDWLQDDMIDVEALWRLIKRIPYDNLDDVIQEKEEAVDLVTDCKLMLQSAARDKDKTVLTPLLNTVIYAESLFIAIRDLVIGMVHYRKFVRTRDKLHAKTCMKRFATAQENWNHHTQRFCTLPGVSTSFRESQFWELTQELISELSEVN